MASQKEINQFLKDVEKKSFRKINYQLQNEDDAIDIIQEAMIKLVQNYQDRDIKEISILYNTILHNCFIDFVRRQNLEKKIIQNLDFDSMDDEQQASYFETIQYENNYFEQDLENGLIQKQHIEIIRNALKQLPPRQSEAFLLRYLEDNSIEETAKIMNCAEGSVKTHCSRAVVSLKEILKKSFNF